MWNFSTFSSNITSSWTVLCLAKRNAGNWSVAQLLVAVVSSTLTECSAFLSVCCVIIVVHSMSCFVCVHSLPFCLPVYILWCSISPIKPLFARLTRCCFKSQTTASIHVEIVLYRQIKQTINLLYYVISFFGRTYIRVNYKPTSRGIFSNWKQQETILS